MCESMPRKPKYRFLKHPESERERALEIIARAHQYEPKLVAGKLMFRSSKVAKSSMPLEEKAEELARCGVLIRRNIERGIISGKIGRKLLRALQAEAEEAISADSLALAARGGLSTKFLNSLEKMVLNRAIKKSAASKIAADYFCTLFEKLPLARSEKPLEWKLRFLEGLLNLLKKEAVRFEFSSSAKDATLAKLRKTATETIRFEAKKTKPAIDRSIFDAIDKALSLGLLTAEQAFDLKATAIKTQLAGMLAGTTSTFGYTFFEPKIQELPEEKRAELYAMLNRLRASWAKR